jgi:hypothetical protein
MCIAECTVTDYIISDMTTAMTKCDSTTCTTTITACEVTGTITTTAITMIINCPALAPYTPWWTDTDQLAPTFILNTQYITDTGTWTDPSAPTTTSAPPPPPPAPPEATCSIQGNLDSEGVAVWTNYVSDGGAAFKDAISDSCAGLGVSDWSVTSSTNTYTDSNGLFWEANNDFKFSLGLARAAGQLECVNEGIANAGGDPNNLTCDFSPAL